MIIWIVAHTVNADDEPIEYGSAVTFTPVSDPIANELTDTEFAFLRKRERIHMENEIFALQKLALFSHSGLKNSYLTFTFVPANELTDENINDSPEIEVRWAGYNRFWEWDSNRPELNYNLTDTVFDLLDFADQH